MCLCFWSLFYTFIILGWTLKTRKLTNDPNLAKTVWMMPNPTFFHVTNMSKQGVQFVGLPHNLSTEEEWRISYTVLKKIRWEIISSYKFYVFIVYLNSCLFHNITRDVFRTNERLLWWLQTFIPGSCPVWPQSSAAAPHEQLGVSCLHFNFQTGFLCRPQDWNQQPFGQTPASLKLLALMFVFSVIVQ